MWPDTGSCANSFWPARTRCGPMRPSGCRQRSAARPPGTPGPAARRQSRCPVPAGGPSAAPPPGHHVTAQRGVAAALPRPSRPGRRAPPATRSGQPGKPGGGHGHGMNDGLRRTQRTVARGGRARGLCVQCQITRRPPMSQLCRNSRIAESASVFAARICSACRLYLRGCRRRLAPASRESWSCCAAWCRQPARRSGGLAAMELLIPLGG